MVGTKVKISFDIKLTYFINMVKQTIRLSTVSLIVFNFLISLFFSSIQAKEISLNEIQMIGSHNSYKQALNPKVLALITKENAKKAAQINYSHPSLVKQLQLGLRHFEIDIVKDKFGGKFSYPKAEALIKQTILTPEERKQLDKPGFKVMHIPDLDFSSHCILFKSCLEQLNGFTKQNPEHLPIIILMNIKESSTSLIDGAQVDAFSHEDYLELDNVLLSTFGDKLITPDEIRGEYTSLEKAVLNKGWPSLEETRGRFLFILDGKHHQLEAYRHNHKSLKDRVMFGSYPEGEPEAALMIRNNPIKSAVHIKELVEKGYMVRTRADSGAGTNSKTTDVKLRTEQAFASGAQIISTDFYLGAPQSLPSGFVVSFKQGMLYRCNRRVGEEECELGN
jgi:hypothetical protein